MSTIRRIWYVNCNNCGHEDEIVEGIDTEPGSYFVKPKRCGSCGSEEIDVEQGEIS